MPLFGRGQEARNRDLFLDVFSGAEPTLMAIERALAEPCRLVTAAGNIAAINAVSSIPPLKRAWAKGAPPQARSLTGVFSLAFLAMTVHSDGVADAVKAAGFSGGITKFGKSGADLIAEALGTDRMAATALFQEFDIQARHDIATNSMALPALIYFHAFCSLKGINAAGYWLGKDGKRLPLKKGLLPLPEPGLIEIVTRAAAHGLPLDEFLPHKDSSAVVPRLVELMSLCLAEAQREVS